MLLDSNWRLDENSVWKPVLIAKSIRSNIFNRKLCLLFGFLWRYSQTIIDTSKNDPSIFPMVQLILVHLPCGPLVCVPKYTKATIFTTIFHLSCSSLSFRVLLGLGINFFLKLPCFEFSLIIKGNWHCWWLNKDSRTWMTEAKFSRYGLNIWIFWMKLNKVRK